MGNACGKIRLSQRAFNHLRDLGIDIDAERQPLVFDGGFVGQNIGQKGEVSDAPQSHSRHRSEAGSRKGQRASARRRSTGEAESFRSAAHEAAFGDQFRVLALHYEAVAFEDRNGLWAAVKTRPLGRSGPQAHLLLAIPLNNEITPRAWAFNAIGAGTDLLPLKHTNFPDASICAFTKKSNAWVAADGLLALVDHYSLWIVKSWHRTIIGWWPGPQVGSCALYRRREFHSREWCGCESGQRYLACHQFPDLLVPDDLAHRQFRALFAGRYEDRSPPQSVMDAARRRWSSLPDMAAVFAIRSTTDEPVMSLL
jgi:hypothetical protein